MGYLHGRSHEIIKIEKCYIQNEISEKIAKFIIQFMEKNHISAYNEKIGKGIVRHIIIKVGVRTNEIMVVIVINCNKFEQESKLIEELKNNFKEIRTIIMNINTKNTNVIMGKNNRVVYGKGYICDVLGEYTFKMSALSFYQTNPIQTEKLYNKAIELAELKKSDIALDLYCGIGTIGIFISKYVKKVYGVEIVEQAVEDAKENAKINNVGNIEFVCGDVENVFKKLIKEKQIEPNVIFVDPPRKGLDSVSIENIIKVKPDKIVYISCNPATFVRDLALLENSFVVGKIELVDMFPFTSHVECVAVLYLKDLIQ